MLPLNLQTTRQVTLYYDSVYDSLIESGKAHPFLYPWSGIGAFVVFGFLLIDYRKPSWLRWLRYPVFAFLFAFQSWCIKTNRAKHPAAAFGVGLLSAWGILWVFAIMIANDCQTDFVRIERSEHCEHTLSDDSNGSVRPGSDVNGSVHSQTKKRSVTGSADAKAKPNDKLEWQPYPAALSKRLDWVADVFCSFRGVGWNWQTGGVPPLPKSIESKLRGSADANFSDSMTMSKTGIRRFRDMGPLLRCTIKKLIYGYAALDVLATIMHNDAYFLGYIDAAPPSYLPALIQESHVLVKCYRLLVSMGGMYFALWMIFSLGPAFFCGVLGSKVVGVRGEAWMNPPDQFGSFQSILDSGLAGWWGGWWHQTFRFAFEAPTTRVLEYLNIEKKSQAGKILSLFIAFFLSGCLHASGSYTQLGDTRPLKGPMRFFLLQVVGILLQTFAMQQLKRLGVSQNLPARSKQLMNFLYAFTWLYFTGPLLADDFVQGGIWLFEPVAISPLRALGLGAKDDTWWCWWNAVLFWRNGKTWWDTGIAL